MWLRCIYLGDVNKRFVRLGLLLLQLENNNCEISCCHTELLYIQSSGGSRFSISLEFDPGKCRAQRGSKAWGYLTSLRKGKAVSLLALN